MEVIYLNAEGGDLDVWRKIYSSKVEIKLTQGAWASTDAAAKVLREFVETKKTIYGVTTGFGNFSNTPISPDELNELQSNLVLSNTVGVGAPLPDDIVRLAMTLKIATIAKGHSGVSRDVVTFFLKLIGEDALPVIPSQGSVGASGDLAPLAHMSAVLLGKGSIRFKGEILPAEVVLPKLGLTPVVLGPKEGLSLLNGTQVSTAIALAGLFETERLFRSAIVTGALSTEATLGKLEAFDPRIHEIRRQKGQITVASALRALLAPSGFRRESAHSGRVQDPYCIRCQPQVMGAILDLLKFAATTLQLEGDAVTDNPLLFTETKEILSGGNFHAEPVAFAADIMAIAVSEIGGISERRIAMLVDSTQSKLPPFLTKGAGIHSGFMTAQIVAAALAAETKQRANPASVDSIPTAANFEDFVSMATHGARRVLDMVENVKSILAIELLAAIEGCDHRGLEHGDRLGPLRDRVRQDVASMAYDRWFEPAIAAGKAFIDDGTVASILTRQDLEYLGS
ncbi:histidine ammonia-lyase [Burkholderia multivorans]|uniref:histidine ammonia-lyase n=1 Tax=Burkholderia ubonensis TaxID=101571 RepID=UPI000F71D91E|nr:histidine ammonia-lyase [Burkholderia ubonensis]AYZ62139.1 histidine ammonia-lyase [Burkholderia multivorans]VWB26023.1 histidine ammonia-lyase [Burkholderia ubonensis]